MTNKLSIVVAFFCFCWAAAPQPLINHAAARPPWTTSRIQGAPTPPDPYRITPAFPRVRFQKPTSLMEIPGENRLLVTEIGGKVFSFRKTANVKTADLIIDLAEHLPEELAGKAISLFSATLHPQFRRIRVMYVCYTHPGDGGHTRVSRFLLKGSPPRAQPKSEQVVITWPSGGHNAGDLKFGKDGLLYISTGDGWGPNPPDKLNTGQDVSDLLGAILRIDVNRQTGKRAYAIPADNPFVKLDGARPEIWAYGLRNPWKFGVDHRTGEIFVADNGWESWEMIHHVVRGGNCGWPIMEGRAVLRSEVKRGPTPIRPPLKDHPHSEANSVIGGPVYRGEKLPDLNGWFVYGDYITGTIWALKADQGSAQEHRTLADTDQRIIAFAEGSRGELFVLDYDFSGRIYELSPSGLKDTSAEFPRRLSETGLFSSVKDMQPAAGVIPYQVRAERWMDGAKAQRWAAIPGDGRIRLSMKKEEPSAVPPGTVLVKHLSLPQAKGRKPIRLETQILHYENGTWRPYSYLWDENGQDAYLVDSIGANRTIQVADATTGGENDFREQTWRAGAVNECRLCHTAASHFVLGFTPHQLNRPIPQTPLSGPEREIDQLSFLADQGVVAEKLSINRDHPGRLVDPHDASQNLDDRARSYLHANCASCHHPGGSAIVSFYLRREMPLSQLNTNKGTGIGVFGIRDARVLAAGDPFRSLIVYRMAKLGYARMPYIGSQVVDGAGVALVAKWIRSLEADKSQTPSAVITTGSADYEALQTLSSQTSQSRRKNAIGQLLNSSEGALALVTRLHAGILKNQDRQLAVSLGYASKRSDIRGLFEHFVPEAKRRARLGPNIQPETILQRTGDVARGKLIYFSDAARCRACHDPVDQQKSLGPTLAEINKKYPRPSELLQHVLRPSLKIEDPVAAYTVTTSQGRVYTGLILRRDESQVVLKTAEKKTITIAAADVEVIQKSQKSLMPDFLLSDLTAQEAADLLAYIRGK